MREGGRWPLRLYESYLNFNGKIILLDLGWAVCVSCPWSSLDLSVFLTSWFSLVAAHLSRVLVSVGSRWSTCPSIWYLFLPLINADQIPFLPAWAGRHPSQALVFVSSASNFLDPPVHLELFPSLLWLWSRHWSQRRGSIFMLIVGTYKILISCANILSKYIK
jgi:hypothetical protein